MPSIPAAQTRTVEVAQSPVDPKRWIFRLPEGLTLAELEQATTVIKELDEVAQVTSGSDRDGTDELEVIYRGGVEPQQGHAQVMAQLAPFYPNQVLELAEVDPEKYFGSD